MSARAREWIRRHRWALVALAVVVPAAVVASLSIRWFSYNEMSTQHPVVVAPGDSGSYAQATFTLTDFTVVEWDSELGGGLGLLEGTEAVSAVIQVDATDSAASDEHLIGCDALLVAPGPDGDRIWEAGSSAIDYFPSGELTAFCSLTDHEVFDWEAVFVVPEGVEAEARLVVIGSWPYRYQLELQR